MLTQVRGIYHETRTESGLGYSSALGLGAPNFVTGRRYCETVWASRKKLVPCALSIVDPTKNFLLPRLVSLP